MRPHRLRPVPAIQSSAFKGFRFPPKSIVLALRWYWRYGLSYRDVEELLGERGIEVDHVTIYRWVNSASTHATTGVSRPRSPNSPGRPIHYYPRDTDGATANR